MQPNRLNMKKSILNVAEFIPDNSLFAKGGLLEPKDAWDRLSIPEKADIIKVGVKHGIFDLQELRRKYNEFKEGGSKEEEEEVNTIVPYTQRTEVVITPDTEYNQYLNTLPDNQRFTPNDKYDSYFYWKLNGKPKNFEEAYAKGMFNYDHSDNSYHANSIAFDDNTGIGYFMKPKDHDTAGYELDWFNKGLVTEEGGKQRPVTPEEAVELNEFRKNYLLIDDPDRPNYYMYQPIKHSIGGPLVDVADYKDENIYGLGDWLKKGLNWLKNSAQVAAIAESPSVMTAAGHRVTREGKAVQDRQNSKDVNQLRQNLANFGEGALGAMTATGDVEAAYNVLRHPIQTARALKEGAKELSRSAADGIEQQAIKLGFNFNKKPNLSEDFIGESLQAAKDYKNSEGYRQLVKNSIKESKQIGTGDFPEETFFTGIHKETPGIIFEERPKGHVASYNKAENIMRLDPNQIFNGEEVPFHEGLHWQRVGRPELDIGPKYEKWSNSLVNEASDNESLAAFLDFFNSPEYIKYQQRGNAEAFLENKVANVLYEDRIKDSELGKASELIAHSLEAGKAQGIKPFSPYPGYTEAIKAIDKARKYDSYLYDIKAGSEDEIKNFWKLLTGNYIPSVTLGGIMTKTLKD